MKNFLYTQCFAVLSLCIAVSFSSCTKLETESVSRNKTITVEFQQVDPEASAIADEATRTEFHDKTIWWSANDVVVVGQYASVNGEMKYKSSSAKLTSSKAKVSVTTSYFNTPDEGTDSYYFSIFPSASFTSYNLSSGHVRALIATPSVQAPTADSFDPAADLLISDYPKNLTPNPDGKYTVLVSYYRQVALGKMHIVNLPSESEIDTIEFSAIHNEANVTLAGKKYYDFTTQGPSSVHTRNYKIVLDYSSQNISGAGDGMTAYFCCYPFELDADDSFTVKVITKAGEVFTRKVTLPESRTLAFAADRGTRFTVDMASATKTDSWLTVNEYSSSSYKKTTFRIYYTFNTTANNVASGKFMAVSESVFETIADISSYLDDNGTDISATSLANLNSKGISYITNTGSLTGDSWYVVMCKLVLDDNTVGIAITRIKTDWFTLTASTRTAGGISYFYYGVDLTSSTRNVRIMATSDLPEGQTFETYYTNTLSPGGMSTSTIEAINKEAGAKGVGYYTLKYYTGKSTQADMVPGTNYTVMVKATNKRGETKFVSVSADAGGTAN